MTPTRFFSSIKIFHNNTTLQDYDLHRRFCQGVMALQFEFVAIRSRTCGENAVLVLKDIEFNAFLQVKKSKFLFFILKTNFCTRKWFKHKGCVWTRCNQSHFLFTTFRTFYFLPVWTILLSIFEHLSPFSIKLLNYNIKLSPCTFGKL